VTPQPRFSLTAWLALLVLGAVVPLLLFAGITLHGIFQASRAASDRGQVDTARALAMAVDGEVRSWRAALLALATSRSLRPDRLAEFYEEAREVARQYEGWIVLNPATGPQLLNTLRPFGAALPRTGAPDIVQTIFRDGKPVTEMAIGAVAQRYIISNAVPVVRDGKVVLCLSLNFGPERLTRLLEGQGYPATWVAAINDSQQRVVARSLDAEARVGKPVVPWFAAATRAANHGLVTGPLIDGRPGQIAFQRLQELPWIVALALPVAELQSAAAIRSFILVGVIVGLFGVGLAVYVGRKVTAPARSLARSSERLLRGEAGDLVPPSAIREVQELQEALVQASAAARAHIEEREQAAEALRQANEALEANVLARTAALAQANEALQATNATLQQEIARRREAEAEIRSLARFPAENPNPILRLDVDGRLLFANAASEPVLRQWGISVGGQAPAPWPDTVRQSLGSRSGSTVELSCGERTFLVFVAPVPEAGYVNLYTSDITARTQAEQALRHSHARLDLLVGSAGELLASDSPQAVVTALCHRVMAFLNCDAFCNYLADEESGRLHLSACGGILAAGAHRIEWIEYGESVCGCAARDGCRIVAEDILHTFDPRAALVRSFGLQAYACHPLLAEGRVLGTLSFGTSTRTHFTDDELALMKAVADQVALAMQRLRAKEALQRANDLLEQRVAERTAELHAASRYARSLLEASLDPLVTIDRAGQISDVNKATEEATGFPRAELIGTDFSAYFTDPENARAGYRRAFREGSVRDHALDLRHRDGRVRSVLYNASVYRDESGEVIGVFAAARDITERRRGEEELHHSREQLRALAAHLESAREEERIRIAREVHDELGQALTGVKIDLAWLAARLPEHHADLARRAKGMVPLVDTAIQQVRRIVTDLRPGVLDDLGLVAAIEWQAQEFQARTGIACEIAASLPDVDLDRTQATAMFRILQETLTNVARHAGATRVVIRLQEDAASLSLTVEDNGRGIREEEIAGRPSLGLLGMRERVRPLGGTLSIAGCSGEGTTVTVVIPLDRPAGTAAPGRGEGAEHRRDQP
jgi:PAS domain S-box-containing protein